MRTRRAIMNGTTILLLAGALAASGTPADAADAAKPGSFSLERQTEAKEKIARSVAAGEPLAGVINGMVKGGMPVDEVVNAAIRAGVDPAKAVSASIAEGHAPRSVVRGALLGGASLTEVIRAALGAGGDRRMVQEGARDAGAGATDIANAMVKADVSPAAPGERSAASTGREKAETAPALVIPSYPTPIGGGGGAPASASPYKP